MFNLLKIEDGRLESGCRRTTLNTVAATPGMMQMKLVIGRPSDKLREVLTLDKKQHKVVTRLLNGQCTFRWHLHTSGLSERTKQKECGQEEEFYHILSMLCWPGRN
jgi:hypothetical protein